MESHSTAWLSPKLNAAEPYGKGSSGVFAAVPVRAGELLTVFGGYLVDFSELQKLSKREIQHSIQVEEGLYLAPIGPEEPADYFNHSCDPNAGLSGQIALVALRDIQPGEEVCMDYAMCDGSPYDEFICQCKSPNCRGSITGNDWRLPELWGRYAGHFSPYLQRRIDKLKFS